MKTFPKVALVVAFTISTTIPVCAGPSRTATRQAKLATSPDYKNLDINAINCVMNSDGVFADERKTGTAGMEWPKGSGKTCVYTGGIWLAGKHQPDGNIRTANMDYQSEYQPGPLLETFNTTTNDGSAANSRTLDNKWRLYKIDKRDVGNPQGNSDFVQWPGDYGAPTLGQNPDGTWQPKFYGDQQLWTVINDVNTGRHGSIGATPPMGVEIQCLYYGFNHSGALGNTAVLRWKIINKSDAAYDSTYISVWSDVDLGDANDDLPGCDTTLSLGFVYNGDNDDGTSHGYGSKPPAEGFDFIEGPKVPAGPADSALVDGQWVRGYVNLPMTSYVVYSNGSFFQLLDPPTGNPYYPLDAYDYQRGLAGSVHQALISSTSGLPMYKWFSGDPVLGTGDLPGNFPLGLFTPQDIRIMLSSGPFHLAKGDTQEVVAAFVIAQGNDRLSSVTRLRQDVAFVRAALYGGQPIASIAPVGTIVPTHSPLDLNGTAKVSAGSITGSQWLITAEPIGSSAAIANPAALTVSITPDLPGTYSLRLVVQSTEGLMDTATVSFQAIDNHPPSVDFAVPSQIVLGDTIHIDGSAIHDVDGDSLAIHWTVDGGSYVPLTGLSYADSAMGKMGDSAGVTSTFFPFRISRFTVKASVSDPHYSVELTKEVVVQPLATTSLQLHSRYETVGVPGLPYSRYYHIGRIKEFEGQLWFSASYGLFTPNFADNANPSEAYDSLSPGNYWVSGNRIFIANGPNVDLRTTDLRRTVLDKHKIPPQLVGVTVSDVYYNAPVLIFSRGTSGVYAYNVTDPAASTKISQFSDGDSWGNFVVDGSLLYGLNPAADKLKVLDITDPSSMSVKNTISLGSGYTQIRKSGNFLYVMKPDTVAVFDVTDASSISPVVFMPVPLTYLPKSRFYDVSRYGNYLAAGTQEGLYVYDVTNPASPSIYGKYLTGYPNVSTYLNATRLVSAQWDSLNPGIPERLGGFLEFEPSITGVEKDRPAIPVSYNLYQNYPNPFNPSSIIRYDLPQRSHVIMSIYNTLGQRVATLVNGDQEAGYHEVRFDAHSLASGAYFYRMQAGSFVQTKKLLVLH